MKIEETRSVGELKATLVVEFRGDSCMETMLAERIVRTFRNAGATTSEAQGSREHAR